MKNNNACGKSPKQEYESLVDSSKNLKVFQRFGLLDPPS